MFQGDTLEDASVLSSDSRQDTVLSMHWSEGTEGLGFGTTAPHLRVDAASVMLVADVNL